MVLQVDNADLKHSINKKLSVTIPEVLKVTNDPRIMSLVVEIAGHLPPKAVPTIRSVTVTAALKSCVHHQISDSHYPPSGQ